MTENVARSALFILTAHFCVCVATHAGDPPQQTTPAPSSVIAADIPRSQKGWCRYLFHPFKTWPRLSETRKALSEIDSAVEKHSIDLQDAQTALRKRAKKVLARAAVVEAELRARRAPHTWVAHQLEKYDADIEQVEGLIYAVNEFEDEWDRILTDTSDIPATPAYPTANGLRRKFPAAAKTEFLETLRLARKEMLETVLQPAMRFLLFVDGGVLGDDLLQSISESTALKRLFSYPELEFQNPDQREALTDIIHSMMDIPIADWLEVRGLVRQFRATPDNFDLAARITVRAQMLSSLLESLLQWPFLLALPLTPETEVRQRIHLAATELLSLLRQIEGYVKTAALLNTVSFHEPPVYPARTEVGLTAELRKRRTAYWDRYVETLRDYYRKIYSTMGLQRGTYTEHHQNWEIPEAVQVHWDESIAALTELTAVYARDLPLHVLLEDAKRANRAAEAAPTGSAYRSASLAIARKLYSEIDIELLGLGGTDMWFEPEQFRNEEETRYNRDLFTTEELRNLVAGKDATGEPLDIPLTWAEKSGYRAELRRRLKIISEFQRLTVD